MKLYILDKNKITKFVLPKDIEESVLVPYKEKGSKAEVYISVDSVNGKWVLKSNGIANVKDNNIITSEATLQPYGVYYLEIRGQNDLKLVYCLPSENESYTDYQLTEKQKLTIGSSANNTISYQNPMTHDTHASIDYIDEIPVITASSPTSVIYLNDTRIMSAPLQRGDRIFINGLKIIWMGNFIRLNNPPGLMGISLTPFDSSAGVNNTNYSAVSEELLGLELYSSDDYFSHTPRLKEVLTDEIVEIDGPPDSEKNEEMPFILTIGSSLTMGAMSLMTGYTVFYGLSTGTRTLAASIPQIVMCVSMLVGMLVFPTLTRRWQKKQKKKREALRQDKYSQYLAKREKEITDIMKNQAKVMSDIYVDVNECNKIIVNNSRRLWERNIKEDDFITIRCGLGNCPAKLEVKAPKEKFSLDEDNLKQMVYDIVNKYRNLDNAPVTLSLLEKRVAAVACSLAQRQSYIDGLILQLVTFQSPADLKLAFFTTKDGDYNFEYAKFLPHTFSEGKEKRLFAQTGAEMKDISSFLEHEFKTRKEFKSSATKDEKEGMNKRDQYKNFAPYYVLIIDNYKEAKEIPIIKQILNEPENYGFSILIIENSMRNLPDQCDTFVYAFEKDSCVFEKNINKQSQKRFNVELNPIIEMGNIARRLANIPVLESEGESSLPSSLSFLDMYSVSKIEQLNIQNRWISNNPTINLEAPVGVHTNGDVFNLDLHEKFHGPHGLIAGSTGSGKSEFIITYILSMAINYSPEEVQFVLIDYKGGGLAGAFENREKGIKIPHLIGTITNLDTTEMNRTLVSIESELKRRQKIFNEVRDSLGESTIDIYKYQRLYREGVIKDPIAHLFIISDEFAELKSQQPEFMDKLISTARIGRSLGVHLILATQKPSGVVNDQIWSNSKFKICLKVQDRSDSMEMLKKPDAASIKETGRFYLQVGYDEYFDIGQSGWSGAKYIPSDRIVKKIDDSINFIDNTGYVIKSTNDFAKKENREEMGDQLTNIVKHIANLGIKQNIRPRQLWLDRIPAEIFVHKLKEKYKHESKPYIINPIIGEYDDPSTQSQGLLTANLTEGNVLVYGMPGSGKENFITTLVYSAASEHSPEEVNFYILDFGSESLKTLSGIPHVGDVALADDQEKIMNLFIMVDEEIEKRKDLFAEFGGNYIDYCKQSGKHLPTIVIIINNYEVFSETNNRLSEIIVPLMREGSKYGIKFVITAAASNAVRIRVTQYFTNKYCLQMADDSDYRNLLSAPRGLIPSKLFGRGIAAMEPEAHEFQTAFVANRDQINPIIKEIGKRLSEYYKVKAPKIPILPEVVLASDLISNEISLEKMPIGIEKESKKENYFNFKSNAITPILSNSMRNNMNFVYGLTLELSALPNTNIKVIDTNKWYQETNEKINVYKDNFDEVIISLVKDINNEKVLKNDNVYIILGIGDLLSKITPKTNEFLGKIMTTIKRVNKTRIILIDDYVSYKKVQIESWYSSSINTNIGVWIGEGIASQSAINFNSLSLEARKEVFNNVAFVANGSKEVVIKHIVKVDDNNAK